MCKLRIGVTKNRWLLFACIFLINIYSSNIIARESDKSPCKTFILKGSQAEYVQCFNQIKSDEKNPQNDLSVRNLSWLRNSTLQAKFTNRVASGKLLYVTLAFDIFPLLDGELGEIVSISLGQSIVKAPEIFLTQLKNHFAVVRLDAIVGNFGPEYVDQFEKQVKLLKKRRAAISKNSNPRLKDIKQQVIKEISCQIDELELLITSKKSTSKIER